MSELLTYPPEWRYLHGKPATTGILKSQCEDFQVSEIPIEEPAGEGEHVFVWIEKRNLNTAFVAEQLAKCFQLPLRAISYAGRKDKFALTRQYFSVHLPGKAELPLSRFQLDGATIIAAKRHNKKLRTGALRGNTFKIRLRDVTPSASLSARLETVKQSGVPNYFGEQRFGSNGSNLQLGMRMQQGETIRNRNKRSMAISALRAYLFNEYIDSRLASNTFSQPITGDVMLLNGSKSFFVAEQVDQALLARLQQRDILISGPMFGKTQGAATNEALQIELALAERHEAILDIFKELGLDVDRRAIQLWPDNLAYEINDNDLLMSFSLPSGCFATSVLREIIDYKTESSTDENTPQ